MPTLPLTPAPTQERHLRLVATEEALCILERAQRRLLAGMSVVPETALSRQERAIVNQLFEPTCNVVHERREVGLPHARMLRSGNPLVAHEQTVFLYFLHITAHPRKAAPAKQPFDDAGLFYEQQVPLEAWHRAPISGAVI
jgi:hypothetical protein